MLPTAKIQSEQRKTIFVLLIVIALLSLAACAADPTTTEKVALKSTEFSLPLNIAHRGARSIAPENTLAAARAGLESGADMWELDVAVTSDGELVLLHDDTLERTSNVEEIYPHRKPWAVHTFTLDELRQLDFGSWFIEKDPFGQIAEGAVSAQMQQSYAGEPMPTLHDALAFTRDNQWRVNVEIKDASGTAGDQDVVEKTVSLIHDLGMEERVIISSFNHDYLRRAKLASGAIQTAALVEDAVPDPASLTRRLGAEGFNPRYTNILPDAIPALRRAGVDVYVWTVNDPDVMRALIRGGASGIITDFPQVLDEILKQSAAE